jgi:uncharacterized protein Veg
MPLAFDSSASDGLRIFFLNHKIWGRTFLISTTCRVFWRKSMNKFGYQPMPVLLRTETGDARRTSNSAIILRVVAAVGTIFALCGVIATCLVAFNVYPPKALESKAQGEVPNVPATEVTPTVKTNPDNAAVNPLPETNQAQRGVIAEDRSILEQTPVPPPSPAATPAAVAPSEGAVSDSDLLKGERPEAGQTNLDRHLPEAVRKKLEKGRRQAERKRSRLEELYGKHAISGEAYKRGEEKYRSEIERYRREMNVGTGLTNEAAGQN